MIRRLVGRALLWCMAPMAEERVRWAKARQAAKDDRLLRFDAALHEYAEAVGLDMDALRRAFPLKGAE